MKITENIGDSLQYPFKDWKKMILLGILLMIPIVNFIGFGYYLRILKSTFTGLNGLPNFKNVGELFIDGLKVILICIIYFILPLVFYILSLVFATSVFNYLPILTGISGIFFLLACILAVVSSIFLYMGIANFAYEGELVAALKYSEIFGIIKAVGLGKYILWWVVLTIIVTVLGLIIGLVGGILLYFLLGFIVLVLGYGYLAMLQARSVALIFTTDESNTM